MAVQLPLDIQLPDYARFDSFLAADNLLLVDVLRQMAEQRGELQVYLWSENGMGKTHLLQAMCYQAMQRGAPACYLPLPILMEHGPQLLDNMETIGILCIDDVHCVAGLSNWERALFSLINRCRAQQTRLIFAAGANINELPWKLADLVSRFSWGPVFQVKALSDDSKLKLLQLRARYRGIELSDDVANYMLRRMPRDIPRLCKLLDTLDRESLVAQRRITIPFVKRILEGSGEI